MELHWINLLNLFFIIAGLFFDLVAIACFNIIRRGIEYQRKEVLMVFCFSTLMVLCDGMCYIASFIREPIGDKLSTVFDIAALILGYFVVWAATCYVIARIRYLQPRKNRCDFKMCIADQEIDWGKMVLAGAVFFSVLALVSLYNHMYFRWSGGEFYLGSFFWLSQIFPILVLAGNLIWILKNHREYGSLNLSKAAVYVVVALLVFWLQWWELKLAWTDFLLEFALILFFVDMHRHLEVGMINQMEHVVEQERMLYEQKNRIMLSQIQPHFVYNALNSIGYLCEEDPHMASDAVTLFAQYLRMNLDSLGNHKPVAFKDELRHTRTYLWLEQLRFRDRIRVEYDIQEGQFALPSLTIQPMVENAIKHGICKKSEGGTIVIKSWKEEHEFLVQITDDGVGFDPWKIKEDGKSHIGIENVRARLKLIMDGELEIESESGKGTRVTIRIPEKQESER